MAGDNLKHRAKRGFIWNTVERLATNGIQFILTVILARLLSPDDYGIIAMPAIFLAIAQVLIDSGFANALIRKQDLNEKDLSTAFYFNIFVGLASYLILFLASPIIADFFKTPILSKLLKVTALVIFFNSLGIVQQALMTKRMDFKIQAVISACSTFFSGVIGVWMAYSGYGVWSLVFQQVSASLLRVALLWFYGHWHPLRLWSKESFHYLWTFGNKIVIIGLLDSIFNNIYAFIIGKQYNANDLGNYTRAQQFVELPIKNIGGIVQRVTFPLLSEIQDEKNRLRDVYLKLIEMTSLLVFPLMMGLAAMADPLIISLLGVKWSSCVIMFQILCAAKIWTPINSINSNLLQVKARTDLLLRVEIGKKTILILAICLTFNYGVLYLISGYATCSVFVFIINTFYTKQLTGISLKDQFRIILPTLFISVLMLVTIVFFNSLLYSNYLKIVIDSIFGFVVFFTYLFYFKHDIFVLLKSNILKQKV